MVVAQVQSDVIGDVPHSADGQLCRRVLVDLLTVAELVDGRNLTGLVDGRLVLHVNLCLELVFCSEVEFADTIVDTNDGGDAHR